MLDLSLNIEMVLTDMEFCDRIRYASELGFKAVEFWDPAVKNRSDIAATASQCGIKVAMCCIKGIFDYTLNSPYPALLNAVRETVKSMKEIECSSIFILSGNVEGRFDSQKNIIIENLKRLSELAEKENIIINIEPVNSLVDLKGLYLDSTYIGFEIIKCVNSDHVKLIYDIYHAQIMEGNIIANITKNIGSISHFHSAAVPGRNEHFLGELDYRNILKAIEKTGYNGYFGVEYTPSYEDHKKSLVEVLKYLRS